MSYGSTIRMLVTFAGLLTGLRQIHAQDIPAYTPAPDAPVFRLPTTGGTLTYSMSGSESIALGYNGNNQTSQSSNLSGNLAYLSTSRAAPFSLIYSGGYLFATAGQPGSFFHNLAASKVIALQRWNAVVADSVSYLPSSPIGGLSGVPGLGDAGIEPVQVVDGQNGSLYSNYGPRVSNSATASLSRSLTNRTSLVVSGSSGIFRFPGSATAGLETNQISATAGITHAISALSSFSGTYSFSRSTYPGFDIMYGTHTLQVQATRRFSRNFSGTIAGGPQYSTSVGVDATLTGSGLGSLTYQVPRGSLNLSFSRGLNSGQGVATTGNSDSASASYNRTIGPLLAVSASVTYSRFVALPTLFDSGYKSNSVGATAQMSRRFTRTLFGYASYTNQHQTSAGSALTVNAFNGTTQTVGFGLTYSPARPIVLGQ